MRGIRAVGLLVGAVAAAVLIALAEARADGDNPAGSGGQQASAAKTESADLAGKSEVASQSETAAQSRREKPVDPNTEEFRSCSIAELREQFVALAATAKTATETACRGTPRAGIDLLACTVEDISDDGPAVDGVPPPPIPGLFAFHIRAHDRWLSPGRIPEAGMVESTILRPTPPSLLILGSMSAVEQSPADQCLWMARKIVRDLLPRKVAMSSVSGDVGCLNADYPRHIIIIPVPVGIARDTARAIVGQTVTGPLQPYDDDRDGRSDEDGPEDINGDGLITQMRVYRPEGKLIARPADDPKLEPIYADAKPGDRERFDLMWEGIDNDGDGLINEDGPGTLSMARDWPLNWSGEAEKNWPPLGRPQVSPPLLMCQLRETRALARYICDHPHICAALVLGGGSNRVLPAPQEKHAAGAKEPNTEAPEKAPAPPGDVLDWLWECRGIPCERRTNSEWSRRSDNVRDYVAFVHPDLMGDGIRVTIGGRTMPEFFMPPETSPRSFGPPGDDTMKACFALMPRCHGFSIVETPVDGDVVRVRFTVTALGTAPTRPEIAVKNRVGMPAAAVFQDIPGLALIGGARRQTVDAVKPAEAAAFEWLARRTKPASETRVSIEFDPGRGEKLLVTCVPPPPEKPPERVPDTPDEKPAAPPTPPGIGAKPPGKQG